LYKSVLNEGHIIYAEEHGINHSLNSGILTFLNVVRCRKEIEKFYRENEHFRELINAMKEKYNSRDSSICCALEKIVNVMFDRSERKKRRHHPRKCSNSLCQMIENDVSEFFGKTFFEFYLNF
jgi:cell division septum initiation protein DivIVA